jgi:hypothetical protein
MSNNKPNGYAYFLWETTGTQETKNSLSRMYPGIPKIVIRNAVDSGIRNFERLKELWQEHDKQVAKARVAAQLKSCKKLAGWTLGEKRDYRNFPD